MRILSGPISALCIIARPIPAYGDPEEGKEDRPDVQLNLDDRVAGETPPDFSFLEGEGDGEGSPSTQEGGKPASEASSAVGQPKEGQEAAKPKLDIPKVPVKDPNEALEIPPVKPSSKEEAMPDPAEEAKKAADAAKKKTEEEAAAKKVEDDKAEAEKKAGEKSKEVKLPTDEEVEAMQPKPGAPAKVIADFKRMKEEVVKPALAEVKRLKAELEAAKAAPTIGDDIKAQLDRAKEDREWREAFEAEKDPVLQGEFSAKAEKAEKALFDFLQQHPRLKMKPDAAEAMKKLGLDTPAGLKARDNIIEAVRKLGDEFLLDEVKDKFKARAQVFADRDAKIAELHGKQGDLVKQKGEREVQERTQWAQQCDENLRKIVQPHADMFLIREAPATASEAEKKEIEEHNKKIGADLVPKFHEAIRAVHARDPEKTMKYVVDSIRVPILEEQVKKAKGDLEAANKRIAELEGDAGKMRRIAPASKLNGAPAKKEGTEDESSDMDLSAEDAVDAFRRRNNLINKPS